MTKIKLMSFNTQHCLGYLARKVDYDLMAKTIMEQGADIVEQNQSTLFRQTLTDHTLLQQAP